MHKTRRLQTLGEEIGNSITHGVMALFAICAAVLMYLKCNTTKLSKNRHSMWRFLLNYLLLI